MENKKVSIIMSTYNTPEEFLKKSIDSILNQTYSNIEFIIVCDGNREEYEKIKKINDNRIKVLLNDNNRGLPYSLNFAIENSTGDYIARMDSDDIAINDRIQKQVEFLEKNENIGLCSTGAILFGERNGKKREPYFRDIDYIRIQLLFKSILLHPSIMAKREVFEKFKYNEKFKYAQDFELWSRISEIYDIAILPIIGLKYRIHNKQVSIDKKKEQVEFAKEIIKNNARKITGEFDEKIYKTLCVLGGKEEIEKVEYKELSDNIDYIISKNINYDKKKLKKVLYNKYFEMIISNKVFPFKLSSIKKCIKLYNLIDVFEVLLKIR